MQPIDYMQGYKSALDSILGQARSFQDLSQNANVLQSQREQNRITTAHNDRRIQAMNELQGVDFNDENAIRAWAGRYGDLEYGKGLNEYVGRLDEQAKKAEIGRVSQVYSLLRNGKDDVAIADLEQQALAYENAGDKANANGARQMAQLIRADRKSALMNVGMAYAHLVPKDTMDNLKDLNSAYAPNVHYQDMGGSMQAVIVDPITGEMKTQHLGDKTQSPDNYADNARALAVAQGGWQNAQEVAHINGGYALDREQMAQAGQNARYQAGLEAEMEKAKYEFLRSQNPEYQNVNGQWYVKTPEGIFAVNHDPNGNLLPQSAQAGGASAIKPLTDTQSNAFTFGTRMLNSNNILSDLERKGVQLNWGQLLTDDDSFTITKALVNTFSSPEQQQYAQAMRDFINATLRKESGAAIGKTEFLNAQKQYFPMPGDSPEVIAQKARNRRIALEGMLAGVPNDFLLSQGIDLQTIKGGGQASTPKSYDSMRAR